MEQRAVENMQLAAAGAADLLHELRDFRSGVFVDWRYAGHPA
jgi:hypothetical protein